MPKLNIRVYNDKLVIKNMMALQAELPRIAKDHIDRMAKRVIAQMKKYPPQRAGSTYQRTYRLRDSWKIIQNTRGVTISGDPVNKGRRYGTYVVGDEAGENQAWMHVGNWLLFRDVVDYEMTKLPNYVENAIRQYARGKGL